MMIFFDSLLTLASEVHRDLNLNGTMFFLLLLLLLLWPMLGIHLLEILDVDVLGLVNNYLSLSLVF